MQVGRVIGQATATIKHPSLNGWRMVIVQPLNAARKPEGDVVLAVDSLGAGIGQIAIINSDGKGARDLVGDLKSPVRWFVVGVEDRP